MAGDGRTSVSVGVQTWHERPAGKLVLSSDRPRTTGRSVIPAPPAPPELSTASAAVWWSHKRISEYSVVVFRACVARERFKTQWHSLDPVAETPLVRRDASEGKGPQRRPQRRLDRRLEAVAKAVGGGYCRLQMPLKLAFGVRGTVAGHRRGALEGGGGGPAPPSNASLLVRPHCITSSHAI